MADNACQPLYESRVQVTVFGIQPNQIFTKRSLSHPAPRLWMKCSFGLKFPALFPLRVLLVERTVGIEIEIEIENQFNTETLDFDTDFDFDFDSKSTNSKGSTNWTSIPFSAMPNAVTLEPGLRAVDICPRIH
jgi:hypothetical protein